MLIKLNKILLKIVTTTLLIALSTVFLSQTARADKSAIGDFEIISVAYIWEKVDDDMIDDNFLARNITVVGTSTDPGYADFLLSLKRKRSGIPSPWEIDLEHSFIDFKSKGKITKFDENWEVKKLVIDVGDNNDIYFSGNEINTLRANNDAMTFEEETWR